MQREGPKSSLDCGDGTLHAFLYRHGLNDHIIIDIPGAFWSFAFGVNDQRQVAMGYFAQPDPDSTTWGAAIYDYATNTHTPVTVFGLTDVFIAGINNHGDLVGMATECAEGSPNAVASTPFVRWKGQDLAIVHPEGAWLTPKAINDNGVIVGALGGNAGFKFDLNTGVWETILHPVRQGEGFSTFVTDIDNKGQMLAVNERHSDGYVESWWLRPLPPKVARR